MADATRTPQVGASIRQLAEWGTANALRQHFGLTNAAVKQQHATAECETIPFGSTITNVSNGGGGKFLQAAIAALALGGGGLGLASLAGLVPKDSGPTFPPPAVESAEPQIIEGVLDWELKPDGEFSIKRIERTGSVGGAVSGSGGSGSKGG